MASFDNLADLLTSKFKEGGGTISSTDGANAIFVAGKLLSSDLPLGGEPLVMNAVAGAAISSVLKGAAEVLDTATTEWEAERDRFRATCSLAEELLLLAGRWVDQSGPARSEIRLIARQLDVDSGLCIEPLEKLLRLRDDIADRTKLLGRDLSLEEHLGAFADLLPADQVVPPGYEGPKTLQEWATQFDVNAATLWRWREKKMIGCHVLGQQAWIDPKDVAKYTRH